MKVAAIGRSEILFDAVLELQSAGHEVCLIVTSRPAPEYLRTAEDFVELAKSIGAKFIYTTGATDEVIESIKKIPEMDIGVSFNHTAILDESMIGLFKHGILNAHGGDLPRYRGNACQAWAIINGEEQIGLCVHKMVPDCIDVGPIIAREYYPLSIEVSVGEVWKWISRRTPVLFAQALSNLAKDPQYQIDYASAESEASLRCYPRRPEDGLIDWAHEPEKIVRLIKASGRPYQGAFSFADGRKVRIWDAQIYPDDENFLAIPGQVALIKGSEVVVIARGGKVLLTDFEIVDEPDTVPLKLTTRSRFGG